MDLQLTEIQLITQIAQNVTATALLLWAVVAFYRGDIISRKTLEQIIAGIVSQIKNEMEERFDEIGKKIDKLGRW
jgi:hypothetical protein